MDVARMHLKKSQKRIFIKKRKDEERALLRYMEIGKKTRSGPRRRFGANYGRRIRYRLDPNR